MASQYYVPCGVVSSRTDRYYEGSWLRTTFILKGLYSRKFLLQTVIFPAHKSDGIHLYLSFIPLYQNLLFRKLLLF